MCVSEITASASVQAIYKVEVKVLKDSVQIHEVVSLEYHVG
jgi:hypothetical protein